MSKGKARLQIERWAGGKQDGQRRKRKGFK
jgi:hypothetical protein